MCGLGIGWRLAQAGCEVTAFDRGKAGYGATWAAAGMLAAGVETEPGEEKLLDLTREAQRRWPDFARELEAASGAEIGYRDEGTLVVALNRDEAERLRFDYDFQTSLGIDLDWITPAEARRREPYLSRQVTAAVHSANDHQVDNRRLGTALRDAYVAAGGELREETEVDAIDVEAGSARGVIVGGERHKADFVVLAAGPWTRDIEGLPDAARVPVRPIKGQMLAVRMDPQAPILSHVVWAPKLYLVPRRDGRLLVGGTVEEKGFDDQLTAGGVFALLEGAWRALPAIEELPIDEFWVGFRPGSRDDAPILGHHPAVPGLVVAGGHHRNGILLAPVTADMVAEAVLSGDDPAAIGAFGPGRFMQRPDATKRNETKEKVTSQ